MAKNRTAVILIALSLSMAAAKCSFADWQYTKWGMTSQQVVEASQGKASPIAEEERKGKSTDTAESLLSAPYVAGKFNFEVSFLFDRKTSKLSRIHLSLIDPSLCSELLESLSGKYGEPSLVKESSVFSRKEWRDKEHENGVQYLFIATPSCSVTYWALSTDDNHGL